MQADLATGGGATRQKVLFVVDELAPEGGGGAVSSWMAQALASAYDVTLLTWNPPDFGAVDRMYGTALASLPLKRLAPSPAEKWLIERIPDDSGFQAVNYLLRIAKRRGATFEAVIGCGVESDFGRRGIQYIHYPYLAKRGARWTVPGDSSPAACIHGLLSGRLRPWMLISGYSFSRMRSNLTLTNSHWTRSEIGPDMEVEVLYPPAPGDFPDIPWERRRDAFVCTSRLVSHKRPDWIAATLALVRRECPGLELHICGSAPQPGYWERLQEAAKAHGPWVQVHLGLSRKELSALLSECRYGIHASIDEHFGIAPAEMARAGCIPFVHASGGQVEVVDHDPRLCYTNAEDAAAKILGVLRDRRQQQELRAAVRRRSERFTPEAFARGLLRHVAKHIDGRRRQGIRAADERP